MTTPSARPFDNQSFTLEGLTVESAADAVAIYGSLTVRQDATGLAHASRLAAFFQDLTQQLQALHQHGGLPEQAALDVPVQAPNPFNS